MSQWKLVPVEPTFEMMEAAFHAPGNVEAKYRAMLAAAPEPAQEPVADVTGLRKLVAIISDDSQSEEE